MPFLIEHITEVVFALLVAVLLGNFFLIGMAIARRQRREKYFQRIDVLRRQYRPVIDAVLSDRMDYTKGLENLKRITGLDRMYMLEQLCLERKPSPAEEPVLRQICEDLGLVEVWQKRLAGEVDTASLREVVARPEGTIERLGRLRFLARAKSAENLGIIRHQASWPLLVKALEDPHPDLQSVASRALASIQEPSSFKALVNQLYKVVLEPATPLSLRSIKSALISFPLGCTGELLPSLSHPNRRIRFLATDIIREMVKQAAGKDEEYHLEGKIFGTEVAEAFLSQLPFDENPDVRARATGVIAYLPDPRSAPVLLSMLQDAMWFVRLHAVRSLSKRKYLPHASQLSVALSDPNWRVREAAVGALRKFGSAGVTQITEHFLQTEDQYSQEQIADEMQRTGLIPGILRQYTDEDDEKAGRVLAQLAQMQKTSYMLTVLGEDANAPMRKKFLAAFGKSADVQIQAWVRRLAAEDTDSEIRALAQAAMIENSAPRGS